MRICFVLADDGSSAKKRQQELSNLKSVISALKSKEVYSLLLYEEMVQETDVEEVNMQALDGGLMWHYKRHERPEKHHYSDPRLDDILYKMIWEYGIDIVHLFFSQSRLPASLAPVAKLLGATVVISSIDGAFACPKGDLWENDQTECSGPESLNKCANCISCGQFARSFAAKHKAIIWNKYLTKILDASALLICQSNYLIEALKNNNLLTHTKTANLNDLLADEIDVAKTINEYYNQYAQLTEANLAATNTHTLSVIIPALNAWHRSNSKLSLIEQVNICLESLVGQTAKTYAQILICVDKTASDIVSLCRAKFTALNLQIVPFENNPDLAALLTLTKSLARSSSVLLLPVDRSYSPNYFAAHLRAQANTKSPAITLGITAWEHSKPLSAVEEKVFGEAAAFHIPANGSKLTSLTPWQGASFPTSLLNLVNPSCNTLAETLGVALPVICCKQAISSLSEDLTLEMWLEIADENSMRVDGLTLKDVNPEVYPDISNLSGAAIGTLTEHRSLGLATMDGIIAYGDYLKKLLHKANPGVWVQERKAGQLRIP
jgi:hypothetical protein